MEVLDGIFMKTQNIIFAWHVLSTFLYLFDPISISMVFLTLRVFVHRNETLHLEVTYRLSLENGQCNEGDCNCMSEIRVHIGIVKR